MGYLKMRKSITLPNKLNEVLQTISSVFHFPESAIISYCIYDCLCHRDDEFDLLPQELDDFYHNYYIKNLPRGKKSKELK